MSEPCCATPALLPPLTSTADDGVPRARALDVTAHAGTVVTLLAIVVLGAAVGSSLGGATAGRPTVTVTYDR